MTSHKIFAGIITTVIVVTVLVLTLTHAQAQDKALNNLSECIATKAITEGYDGNPYSYEAWVIFSNSCK